MLRLQTVPVYLALAALALAAWAGLSPDSTSPVTFGWAVAGMLALYVASALVTRAGRSEPSAARSLDAAARLNAARVAPPPTAHAERR